MINTHDFLGSLDSRAVDQVCKPALLNLQREEDVRIIGELRSNVWIKLRLLGRENNRSGIGAQIRVIAMGSKGNRFERFYHMSNKTSFGSAPYVAHIGLGDAVRIEDIEVMWPGATQALHYSAELRQTHTLDQAKGQVVARKRMWAEVTVFSNETKLTAS